MSLVAKTSLDFNLQATKIDSTKWLITSTKSSDTPIAVVVDSMMKESIMAFEQFYKSCPRTIIHLLKTKYNSFISFVNRHTSEASSVQDIPEYAKRPLLGETTCETIDATDSTPEIKKVIYFMTGNGARYCKAFVDADLYVALSAISNDWSAKPDLYYYVLTHYYEVFKVFIEKNRVRGEL